MTVQKSVSSTLVFTSEDGRARVEIGSQLDFSYTLDGGGQSVVSLPLSALPTLHQVIATLTADPDVQALIPAPEPEPEEEPVEEPVEEPEEEPTP